MRKLFRWLVVVASGFCFGTLAAGFIFSCLSEARWRTVRREAIRNSQVLRWEALADSTVVSIEKQFDGQLLLGTVGDGLWVFDPQTGATQRLFDSLGSAAKGVITCIVRTRNAIFAGTYDGPGYQIRGATAVGLVGAASPIYSCDGNLEEEYILLALWRGLALWSASVQGVVDFQDVLSEGGIVSAAVIGKDEIAWSRLEGSTFRGRISEGRVVGIERLPSVPPGLTSLAWFKAARKLILTHSNSSFELKDGGWQRIPGRGGYPLKVLSCKHVVGEGCWIISGRALGILRADGKAEWIAENLPIMVTTAFADLKSRRVFVGTVGCGLLSFPLNLVGNSGEK